MSFEVGLWLAETTSQMWFCVVFLLLISVDFSLAHSENRFHFRIPGMCSSQKSKQVVCLVIINFNKMYDKLGQNKNIKYQIIYKRDNTGGKFKSKIKIKLNDFRTNGFLSRISVIKISIETSENDFGGKSQRRISFTKHREILFYS